MLELIRSQFKEFDEEEKRDKTLAVIIAPSRQLILQISSVLEKLLPEDIQPLPLLGGSSLQKELDNLKQAQKTVVITTVGRLYNILDQKQGLEIFDPNKLQILVIDQADKVLDSSHSGIQLSFILSKFPKQRRTGLFSATMSSGIRQVIKAGMRNPYFIDVKAKDNSVLVRELTRQQIDKIEQTKEKLQMPSTLVHFSKFFQNQSQKLPYLLGFIKQHTEAGCKVMVFLSCCASVDFHHWVVRSSLVTIPTYKLHRKLIQKKRTQNHTLFAECQRGAVLFTTDLGARGIDIEGLDWIVHFDPPKTMEMFIHRSGRTARAGHQGSSLILLLNHEQSFLKLLNLKDIYPEPYCTEIEQRKVGKIKKKVIEDRSDYNKAASAFVAHVRSYKELELKYIFKFSKLEPKDLAEAFCLPCVPHMKQFRDVERTETFKVTDIPFRNKNQEKQINENKLKRIQKMEEKQALREEKAIKQSGEAVPRRKPKSTQQGPKRKKSRAERRKAKRENSEREWDELAKQANLLKKLKKGKISEAAYEEEMSYHKY